MPSLDVTELLAAWREGDPRAFDQLASLVYGELRRLAQRQMRRERPDHTLQPTALVNEVFVRLVNGQRVEWRDRAHFFAVSARIMRRILVDLGRARRSVKRGAGANHVLFDETTMAIADQVYDVVDLDEALNGLQAVDARKARVVELRFFGGLTWEETAAEAQVSVDTVQRDWQMAKAWLARRLVQRESRP